MSSQNSTRTILIVDDDRGISSLIQRHLQRQGFQTESAAKGSDALSWLYSNHADLMLLDYRLPDMTGEGLLHNLAENNIATPFIVITGQGNEQVAVNMLKQGARDYLVKDSHFLDELPSTVTRTLEQLVREDKQRETELQLTTARAMVDQCTQAVIVIDAESGRLIDANSTLCQWLDYTRAELLQLDITDIAPTYPFHNAEEGQVHVAHLRRSGRLVIRQVFAGRKADTLNADLSIRLTSIGDQDYIVAVADKSSVTEGIAGDQATAVHEVLLLARHYSVQRIAPELGRAGFQVNVQDWPGLRRLQQEPHDLIIIAEELCDIDGIEVLPPLRHLSAAPIIVIGSGTEEAVAQSLLSGADAYFDRSMPLNVLISYIRTLMSRPNTASASPDL